MIKKKQPYLYTADTNTIYIAPSTTGGCITPPKRTSTRELFFAQPPTTKIKKIRGNIRAHHIATAYMSLRLREKRKKIRQAAVQTENVTSSPVAQKSKCTFRVAFAFQHLWPTSQPANVYVLSVAGTRSRRARDLHKGKREREKTAKETKRRPGGIIESHQQHRFQPGHQAGLLQLVPFASSEIGPNRTHTSSLVELS